MPSPPFLFLFILAFVFGFLDGFHGSASVVATAISSRALRPRQVLVLASVAEFIGPFLFGVAVANTIGRDLTDPLQITLPVVVTAVLAAIIWKVFTWWGGIPSSSSHALLGGLLGALLLAGGPGAIKAHGLLKISASLFLSPIIGLLVGYLIMQLILLLTQRATPAINNFFKQGQLFTIVGLALSHSGNDAQKTMGIMTLGLVATGMQPTFQVPFWVIVASAAAMALGTLFSGQRIIKTVGSKFYKIRPVHGFGSQVGAGAVIMTAALLGGPVSTTQVISSTVVGVGSAERLSKVRWHVFTDVGLAWIFTIPLTALLAVLLHQPITFLMRLW
jgi:inorganic phosphate transporter, PiT family